MEISIPDNARIIIIEGVAGSGKDTLQQLLKKQFKDKVIYDYAEGDLLFTWKLARVKEIGKLRLELLNHFTDFISEIITEEPQSIFLLNRFHLSNYMAHVSKDEKLRPQYDQIIGKLKKLPVHILLLQLTAEEINKRSSHTERPGFWKRYQKIMIKEDGFTDRIGRYLNEQKLMLNEAKKNNLSYSIIHLDL